VTASTHVLIILPIAYSTSGPESCRPPPALHHASHTPLPPPPLLLLAPITAACYHRRRSFSLHRLNGRRCCQPPSPPAADCHRPPPTFLRPECTGSGRCARKSPKRQWGPWGGGCAGGGADHGATGAKMWPLPTTSRRNDVNTEDAAEGGSEGKTEDTGQGSEIGAEIGGRKAKTANSSAEWVGAGGGRRVGGPVGAYKERGEDPRGWQ